MDKEQYKTILDFLINIQLLLKANIEIMYGKEDSKKVFDWVIKTSDKIIKEIFEDGDEDGNETC